MRLKDKVAIITGGGTGIGEAICKKFAIEGAKVVVAGLPDDPVDQVVNEINDKDGEAIGFNADLSKMENAKKCIDRTLKQWEKIDILINNAGVFPEMNELDQFSEEAFDYLIDNNIKSAFVMSKQALPELKKTKGTIISTGSEAGKNGLSYFTPYGGTKGFLHAFTEGLAVEQAKYGIRVNAVCPGAIDTAWTHKETGPFNEAAEKMAIQGTPFGRRGTPEEIANAFCFLASDEASYVNGSLFSVDGGLSVSKGNVGDQTKGKVSEKPEGELNMEHKLEGHTEIRK